MEQINNFLRGKLQTDFDERMVPNGEYVFAENIRVSTSLGSNVGAINNVLGNKLLQDIGVPGSTTIGTATDESTGDLYYFTTSATTDGVYQYDVDNDILTPLLLDTTGRILNFSTGFLITGANVIVNSDFTKSLLSWTDDLNPPRILNIERAKTYGLDGFIEDDISVIKKPPRFPPEAQLTFTTGTLENNIDDKFLSFSYRYKYLDGGFSALSSFTNYVFEPGEFDVDFQTLENDGMINAFNAVDLSFDTGSERVTDIELVFKESNSNNLFVIETLNKEDQGWSDNEVRSQQFINNKIYAILPEDEIFRNYDNVPRLAKAQEFVGNRLMYADYVEGYNLLDSDGNDINLDYTPTIVSTSFVSTNVPYTIIQTINSGDTIVYDFTEISLVADTSLLFDTKLSSVIYGGSFDDTITYILNKDYSSASALVADADFSNFITVVLTGFFTEGFTATNPPPSSSVDSISPFSLFSVSSETFSVMAPSVVYSVPVVPFLLNSPYAYLDTTSLTYQSFDSTSSLKSNRSYEIGVLYLDEYNRSTTVLTSTENTAYVNLENSIDRNRLLLAISSKPPFWADRYKYVIKQDKTLYQTLYINLFYEDGLFRWARLEGENKNKVAEGDTLIVKSDLGGPLDILTTTKVIEVVDQPADFISSNPTSEEAGLYMKLKPIGFSMNATDLTFRNYVGSQHQRYPTDVFTAPVFGTTDGGFTPFPLNTGSKVRIFIKFEARGSIAFVAIYDQSFVVQDDYTSIEDWFNAEVGDLGDFGTNFTRSNGFTVDGSQYFVRSHRDGTASRSITTDLRFEVFSTEGILIFETKPLQSNEEIFFETEEVFEIINGEHQGNVQNQSPTSEDFTHSGTQTVVITSNTFTSPVFGTIEDTLFTPYNIPLGSSVRINVTFFAGGAIGLDAEYDQTFIATAPYNNMEDFFDAEVVDLGVFGATYTRDSGFNDDGSQYFVWSATDGTATDLLTTTVLFEVSLNQPGSAKSLLNAFNCFSFGNGAESFRYKDEFNSPFLNIDLRPTSTSVEGFSEVRRYADITYSSVYNENSNLNGLNEFNLSLANFKDDIDKKYGSIQKLYSRDTDLVVFQETKTSKVLVAKNLLLNADGTANVSSIETVLGQQVPSAGEYGIARNPEGFAFWGNRFYVPDGNRGVILRHGLDGYTEISRVGMRGFFKNLLRDNPNTPKFGAYDPVNDEYVLNVGPITLTYNELSSSWTSFYSYQPEYMANIRGRFMSFNDGNLFVHDDVNSDKTTFYGTLFPTKISVIVNPFPSEIKVFENLILESNVAWDAVLTAFKSDRANPGMSTISESEFAQVEGYFKAYIRRDETSTDNTSKSTYGLGTVSNVLGPNIILIEGGNTSLTVGDNLHLGSTEALIGNITAIDGLSLTLTSTAGLTIGDFVYGAKDRRIEGAEMRGYAMRVDLEQESVGRIEIFALKSYGIESHS